MMIATTDKMKTVTLTNGLQAIIDEEDFEKVSKYKWTAYSAAGARERWYPAVTIHTGIFKRQANRSMARVVLGFPQSQCIDHINGNPLDNRKSNLRIASYQQNSWNTRKRRIETAASKYKGVSSFYGKWRTYIGLDRKKQYVGYFPCQFCAALAYDMAAIEHYGEFANTNILPAPRRMPT